MKKKALIAGAAIFAAAGCGAAAATCAPYIINIVTSEQVTAESLLENMFCENADGVLDMDLKADMQIQADLSSLGQDVKGTVEVAAGVDLNIKTNSKCGYADGTADVKIMGFSTKVGLKSYHDMESGTTYSYDEDSDKWTSKDGSGGGIFSGDNVSRFRKEFKDGMLKDVTLKEHKRGTDYEVTASIDADSVKELVEKSGIGEDSVSFSGFLDSINDAEADMNVSLVFDKDTKNIKSVEFNIEIKDEETSGNISAKAILNQIGGEIELSIPDDVKENAVKDESSESVLDSMQGTENGTDSEQPDFNSLYGSGQDEGSQQQDNGMDNTGTAEESGSSSQHDMQAGQNQETQTAQPGSSPSMYGSFNGEKFGIGFPVSRFTDDGWKKADYSSDNGIFISYENEKYPEAELSLYGKKSTITEADLTQSGACGYRMNVMYCEDGAALPQADFGGLTWKASKEDIISVYGQPESITDGPEGVSSLSYRGSDGTNLTFRVNESYDTYAQNPIHGLVSVEIVNYSIME